MKNTKKVVKMPNKKAMLKSKATKCPTCGKMM